MNKKVALSIEGLKVRYGSIEAIKGINIDVCEGSVVALLGANGAGKTTTLQTVSGLVPADVGKIKFYDQDITNMDAEKIAALGIAQSPERTSDIWRFNGCRKFKGWCFYIKR